MAAKFNPAFHCWHCSDNRGRHEDHVHDNNEVEEHISPPMSPAAVEVVNSLLKPIDESNVVRDEVEESAAEPAIERHLAAIQKVFNRIDSGDVGIEYKWDANEIRREIEEGKAALAALLESTTL